MRDDDDEWLEYERQRKADLRWGAVEWLALILGGLLFAWMLGRHHT